MHTYTHDILFIVFYISISIRFYFYTKDTTFRKYVVIQAIAMTIAVLVIMFRNSLGVVTGLIGLPALIVGVVFVVKALLLERSTRDE